MSNQKTKIFFYVGLSIVILLVLLVFFIGVYESITGKKLGENSILNNPEIISVVIGLIVSLLFFERWKALESRVQKLSEGPVDTLKSIQDFSNQEIEQKFKAIESKAQTLTATISGLIEKHPWLEVITEREMIVETDSCRGILRTCHTLLHEEKFLHLFEYLEYCSRKGTAKDKRKDASSLNGTADDFYELSQFCEIWLGDYYLSSQFLKRYIEQYPESAHLFLPFYIRKLIRIGDLGSVKTYSKSLRKKVYGENFIDRIKMYLGFIPAISDRYKWLSSNALALADTSLGEDKWLKMYNNDIQSAKYSKIYKVQQLLYNAEMEIQIGNIDEAKEIMNEVEQNQLQLEDLRELSLLYSKIGDDEKAQNLYDQVMSQYDYGFGENNQFNNKEGDEHSDVEKKEFKQDYKKKENPIRKKKVQTQKIKQNKQPLKGDIENENPSEQSKKDSKREL